MPVWLIVAIVAAWILIPFAVLSVAAWHFYREEARGDGDGEVIELRTGYAGCEPRPHAGLDGLREALDAAARMPRSEPFGVEPRSPRDRPGPGLRA